jgi:large conductance mechanosensitive channel
VLKGFKEFILRGNVIDLAVAVVIGAAFTAVVNSIVENVFNPLIGAIFRADSLDNALVLTIPLPGEDAKIRFGAVFGAIITFLIVASVVYFVFVMPMNLLKERADARRQAGEVKPEDPETELTVLAEIRDLLAAERGAGTGSQRADER